VVLYLDGLKKDKVKVEVKQEDEKYKGAQECTFRPQINSNYQEITPRLKNSQNGG
jgi:hypothetical protein